MNNTFHQFVKFMLVGFSNLAVDASVYYLLTRPLGADEILAKVMAATIAIGNSYVLNRRWTFQASGTKVAHELTKFIIVQGFGLVINSSTFAIFFRWLKASELVSYALAVIFGMVWNFSFNKGWVFHK